jgi:hypothetical protein
LTLHETGTLCWLPEPTAPRCVLTFLRRRGNSRETDQGETTQMDKDIIDTPIIDPNLVSYEKFFDHDWAESTFEAVKNTPLEDAVGALVVAWRSTNGAHILPWLMVESLKRYAHGEVEGSLRYRADYSGKVIKGIVEKLVGMMQYNLNSDQRLALKRAVVRIEQEAHAAVNTAQSQVQFDVAGYWNFLVQSSEFMFCILGTQRINYGSLFFAYEDFVANVIRTKQPTYSSKTDPIKEAFARHIGEPLRDYCWTDAEVDLARLVRNALAHNGGRIGKDLEKYKACFADATGMTTPLLRGDQFNIVGGKIQITPDNTKHLFGILKERVSKIVEELA